MQTRNAQADIRALVDSFVADLTQHVRAAALEAVQSALQNGDAPRATRAAAAPRQSKGAGKKAGRPGGAKGGRRSRRSPEEIQAAKEAIARHVQANPGTAMSDLSGALGEDPTVIRAQLNELLAEGTLRKEGERRGTRYFAGGRASGKPATGRGKGKGGRRKATKQK